jgi:hypothetical protein
MVQPFTRKDRQHVQQLVITLMPTIVQVTTSLPTYVPKCYDHQRTDGGQLGNSPKGDPPFNPHVASFGWLAPDPRMFIPPWYQPPIVQPVLELATKPPYKKLQYPTYIRDTGLDVHIRVVKKEIKANGETMEVDIINLFGFTCTDNIFE